MGAHSLESLRATPNSLAPHYGGFGVAGPRILLTGHSHQAWPDVARDGVLAAFDDAARDVDEKWTAALARADEVRAGLAPWLGVAPEELALGANTHELVVRFLSSLELAARPRLITTDGEFHTLRRQLDRLAEDGRVEVVKLAASPVDTLAERLAAEVDARTSAVLVSAVLFESGRVVRGLSRTLAACRRVGAELLVDAYHALGAMPYRLGEAGLDGAFVVGGGYKYLQLGEGVCYLRVPPLSPRFPLVTGWYSEFARLTQRPSGGVAYGEGPARWAGATYDPTSHYRAARVLTFFRDEGLTPDFLRAISQHQVARLGSRFDALGLRDEVVTRARETPLSEVGGFLALRSPHAAELQERLRARGVWTDHRGQRLRLGPAPYLSDAQLDRAIEVLGEVARDL